MNINIRSVANPGDAQRERVVLDVSADADVGRFAILRTTIVADKPNNVHAGKKLTYWFPDKKVQAGDTVVLYSKKGVAKEKPLSTGKTAHFFYWGLDTATWGQGLSDAVVLLSINQWSKFSDFDDEAPSED